MSLDVSWIRFLWYLFQGETDPVAPLVFYNSVRVCLPRRACGGPPNWTAPSWTDPSRTAHHQEHDPLAYINTDEVSSLFICLSCSLSLFLISKEMCPPRNSRFFIVFRIFERNSILWWNDDLFLFFSTARTRWKVLTISTSRVFPSSPRRADVLE